jgi:tetratricopeptide (TPR) repeat protein
MKRVLMLLGLMVGLASITLSNPDSLLLKANESYSNSKFEEAAALYQQLIDSGYRNDFIYFNLANSFFKINRLPQAIVNYERAYLLNPNDEDIEFNLEYARTFTLDRIEPLPEFVLIVWYRNIRAFLSSNGWALLSLFFLASTLVLLLLFWFSIKRGAKKISFAAAIVSILFTITTLVFSKQEKDRIINRNDAIIFQPVVSVKSSPGESGKDIFILHAGTKVKVVKALGEWVEIRIADGNKGWVQSIAVELI